MDATDNTAMLDAEDFCPMTLWPIWMARASAAGEAALEQTTTSPALEIQNRRRRQSIFGKGTSLPRQGPSGLPIARKNTSLGGKLAGRFVRRGLWATKPSRYNGTKGDTMPVSCGALTDTRRKNKGRCGPTRSVANIESRFESSSRALRWCVTITGQTKARLFVVFRYA